MQDQLSVIFSFRNEAEVLEELIKRVVDVLDAEPEKYEIIFVNDDSTDNSLQILKQQREKNPRIKVVNMARRFGVSECVLAGMAHASGDAIIYMDADLQDPPEVIPLLLQEWRGGADVVHTVRRKRMGESKFKMFATQVAYRAITAGSAIKLPVEAGDFKLLSRHAVQQLLSLPEKDPYLRGLVVWIGFTQAFVEYQRDARAAGTTHFPLFSKNPWKTFVSGLTSFSFLPIYAILVAGILFGLVSGAIAFFSAIAAVLGFQLGIVLWLTFLIIFSLSILLLAIGIIGVYIIRIYKDVRGRPAYIVRDLIGIDRHTNPD